MRMPAPATAAASQDTLHVPGSVIFVVYILC